MFSKKSQWQSAQEIVTLGSEHLASCSHRNAARNVTLLIDTHCTCLKHDRLHCFTSCYKQIKLIEYPISSISYHVIPKYPLCYAHMCSTTLPRHRLEVGSLEPSLKIYNSFIASCARTAHWLRASQTLRKLKLG